MAIKVVNIRTPVPILILQRIELIRNSWYSRSYNSLVLLLRTSLMLLVSSPPQSEAPQTDSHFSSLQITQLRHTYQCSNKNGTTQSKSNTSQFPALWVFVPFFCGRGRERRVGNRTRGM